MPNPMIDALRKNRAAPDVSSSGPVPAGPVAPAAPPLNPAELMARLEEKVDKILEIVSKDAAEDQSEDANGNPATDNSKGGVNNDDGY